MPLRPTIALQPRSQTIAAGGTVAFSVGATGTSLTYQWRRNGVPIGGTTGPTYLIANAPASAAAFYTVDVANTSGSVTSESVQLTVVTANQAPSRISNLSIRSQAGAGAETLIVGLAIGGNGTTGAKPLLLRAVGPALAGFGVPNTLPDPRLEVYAGPTKINENDNWGGDAQVAAVSTQIGAFSLGTAAARDAALYHPAFATGGYTIQITGSPGTSGVALAEIYDTTTPAAFAATTPRLVNVSARTRVGTSSEVLIAGFIVDGPTAKTVLIRGIGPTLTAFGVPGALTDPKLEIFSGTTLVQSNDNWGGDSVLPATFLSAGAFPLSAGSLDAAMVVTLAPGSYTAQVSGMNAGTGVGLVELYEIP